MRQSSARPCDHLTGGTDFSDQGDPNIIGNSNVIAGVTSFGINANLASIRGLSR